MLLGLGLGLDVAFWLGDGFGVVVGFDGLGDAVAVLDGDGDGKALDEALPVEDGEDDAEPDGDDEPDDDDEESELPEPESLEFEPSAAADPLSELPESAESLDCSGPTAMICMTGTAVVCDEVNVSLSLAPSTYVTSYVSTLAPFCPACWMTVCPGCRLLSTTVCVSKGMVSVRVSV